MMMSMMTTMTMTYIGDYVEYMTYEDEDNDDDEELC